MRTTLSFACIAVILAASAHGGETSNDEYAPPDDFPTGWYARIETSMGRVVAMLHPEQAPQAVAYFAGLAEGSLAWSDPVTGQSKKSPYYDGIEINFVRAGHLFEVGYRYRTGDTPRLWVPHEKNTRWGFRDRGGRLGMTTSGAGISGVVFFVTASPMRGLDGKYPCFGTVVSDLETVFRISEVKTLENGRPGVPVTIEKIRIFKVGNPPPLAEPEPYVPSRVPLEERMPDEARP